MADVINNNDIRANNARKILFALRNGEPTTKKDLSEAILEGTDRSFKLSMDDVLDMVSPFR